MPSCGALTYLHDGIAVTVLDLVTLMIIFSDNTATNVLIDLLGIEEINRTIRRMGYRDTVLQRKDVYKRQDHDRHGGYQEGAVTAGIGTGL